jgi:site-specific recombinase XerD
MIRLGKLGLMKVKVPTFNEFIPEYVDYIRKVRGNTSWKKSEYSLSLFAKYFGERMLSEITPLEVDDFKKCRLGEGIAAVTVNLELARVRSLFIFALRRKRYFSSSNPVSEAGMIPNVDSRRERVESRRRETSVGLLS